MNYPSNGTENLFPRAETPNPFSPDWHHQFGAKLSAFPRYLIAPMTTADTAGGASVLGLSENAQFWPDLATFVEGPCWSVMMYYPGASRASVCVLHWQGVPRWEAVRFEDEVVVAKTVASTYHELMEKMDSLTAA